MRASPARSRSRSRCVAALERGKFEDFATMARALGFARARITQVMDLPLLTLEILEDFLFPELPAGALPVSERGRRETPCRWVDW